MTLNFKFSLFATLQLKHITKYSLHATIFVGKVLLHYYRCVNLLVPLGVLRHTINTDDVTFSTKFWL